MTPDTDLTYANEQLYMARDTQQIIVEGDYLRIGVGNIRLEDDSGEITAGLWFFVRGNPDLEQVMRVRENEEFEFINHRFRVVEINLDTGYVVLGIQSPIEADQE